MRTTINISDDLIEMAKLRAIERKETLGQVIEEALRIVLNGNQRTEKPPFELIVFNGDGPLPGVDLDRTSDLLELEEREQYNRGKH